MDFKRLISIVGYRSSHRLLEIYCTDFGHPSGCLLKSLQDHECLDSDTILSLEISIISILTILVCYCFITSERNESGKNPFRKFLRREREKKKRMTFVWNREKGRPMVLIGVDFGGILAKAIVRTAMTHPHYKSKVSSVLSSQSNTNWCDFLIRYPFERGSQLVEYCFSVLLIERTLLQVASRASSLNYLHLKIGGESS